MVDNQSSKTLPSEEDSIRSSWLIWRSREAEPKETPEKWGKQAYRPSTVSFPIGIRGAGREDAMAIGEATERRKNRTQQGNGAPFGRWGKGGAMGEDRLWRKTMEY